MITISIALFLLGSAVSIYFSRASLLAPRSHGFYRFFAWETILGLISLNLRHWIRDPLAWNQIISWILLLTCLVPLILGLRLLKRAGRPDPERDDASLLALEKTTELVSEGIYRYIRHPMYSSLLFLAWGAFFKNPSLPGILLALAATVFLIATAMVEEKENIRYFGPPYQAYMKETRMFVPYLF